MELTELCLALKVSAESKNMNSSRKKRKLSEDDYLLMKINETSAVRTTTSHVDLQLEDPLPLDWEQCLDLKSGKVYYLNRETSKKSWKRPLREELQDEAHLDLELHISSTFSADKWCSEQRCRRTAEEVVTGSSSNSMMLALACLNCHLLVILSKTFPRCPNCKYVHSFPLPSVNQNLNRVLQHDRSS
ncbi:protein CURLY FLAG LEAF 1-like [Argentina anserina]|uniref:protein CURLY FLAG LEAF 1-like n=1 Tax=Argentina anserina TaxID=57926 RepID=UPI0021763DCD|nr:protein CURLY FLAG LEAF 1-like [Potentilla anserina]